MTVIAWDGKILAADKRAQNIDIIMTMTKIFVNKKGDMVCAIAGCADQMLALRDWAFSGMNPKKWPQFNRSQNDGTSTLSVIKHDKKSGRFIIMRFESEPYPIIVEDVIYGAGSGRDVALGVMNTGHDAIKAVEIASQLVTGCGNGVDAYTWVDASKRFMKVIIKQ